VNATGSSRLLAGGRLDLEAAGNLYGKADLLTLGQLAQEVRFRWNPDQVVTYAVDRNINYTNICVSRCAFCAFARDKGDPEAYVLDQETLTRKCEETLALGGTQILYQGGLNPDLDLAWHLDRIRLMCAMGLHVHGFSPPEIVFMAKQNGLSLGEVIERLVGAGLGSIPGGGAEILVDRVRRSVSPAKATRDEWLEVMRTAHTFGLKTTATMMFGHLETPVDRLEHLFLLRRLQDETGGFTAFIPWPYQPGHNTLPARPAGSTTYLRLLALSRLVLDNFPHIQASWVTQGPYIGQVALHFGADDLGSTMIEENVVAAAGLSHRLSRGEMVRLIEAAGFRARQRNTLYQRVEPVPEGRP
jgi:cyclic dehypoxanthinyl futalosine synthase